MELLRPEVPPELGAVVRKMMAKSPADRFPTPADAATGLAPFAEPGDCEAHFVLELDEQGLADLDPKQPTDEIPAPRPA